VDELTLEMQIETLLENHFFTLHLAAPLHKGETLDRGNWNVEQRTRALNYTWNVSTEGEGSCTCCVPTSLAEAHVQGGSEIECIVEQDGVYLHTLDEKRSQAFHDTHLQKEKRFARAREWGLHIIPIGPLWRGEKIVLALNEAKQAHEQGLVRMNFSAEKMRWSCRKTGLAMTQLHAQLIQREQFHATRQNALVQPYLNQYQLAYTLHTPKEPLVNIHSLGGKLYQEWTGKLPLHLQTGETAWRDSYMIPQWKATLE
jgi:hypothetical protein